MRIFLRIMLAAAVCCAGQRANAQLKSAPAAVSLSIPQARPIPDPADTLEIIVIGDVMMHSKQLQHDHRSFLREITPALRKADFAVANLEFPLAGEPYTGYPAFSTPDWYPAYVADCGVDVFLTANNHVLDQGSAGFARTLRVYGTMAAAGSATYTGSGPDEASFKALNPLILEKRGIKVALVNFCYGSNRGADALWPKMARMRKEEVHAQILRARQEGADFVVALPHWGDEYQLHPNTSQQEWARWLVTLTLSL